MTTEARQSEAAAVAEIVKEHIASEVRSVEVGTENMCDVLILPKGLVPHSVKPFLDAFRTAPERREGTAKLGDLDSFIAHAKRFADTDSAIFASRDPAHPSLLAVLDYHRVGAEGAPRFGRHRAVYAFPVSDEWKAWTTQNAEAMPQADFAAWIENRLLDVADPATAGETAREVCRTLGCELATPTKLLELSRGLSVRVDSRLASHTNLSTGEGQLTWAATHQDEAGAPLRVPGAFLLAIPVFRSGAVYQLPVRLRYRARDGRVVWFFEIYRAERAFDHALQEAQDKAAAETGLPVYVGSPEA